MFKAFKYRLYPKPKQAVMFAKHFGCVRYIYNWGLEQKIKQYQLKKKSLSCFQLCKMITHIKKQPDTCWLSEVNSQALQQSVNHLDNAFTKFFREKKGFPKFKSRSNRQSFSCPQNVKVDFHNSTIYLPKIGDIKTVFSREFTGKIKTCTVSRTSTGKYFVSILVETHDNVKSKPQIRDKKSIGVDLGIKEFCFTEAKFNFTHGLWGRACGDACK